MANPMNSAQFVRLLDERLREVSEAKFKELPSMIDNFYRRFPSDSAFEEFFDIGSLPDIPEFTGKLEYLSVSPGFHKKIEPKEYAAGMQFERKLIEDKKYAVMDNRAELLATSANRTQEKIAVRPFAYATTASFDFMTSEEGVALASSSHTTKSGASTSVGFSNAGTSALSATSVAATRLLMRKFRDDLGQRITIEPDTLIVPDNLEDKALEIVGTEKGLYSAEGTKNVQMNRFKVIPYLRLDDYDTNDWMMVDSKLMKRFLIWIDRVKPEPGNTIDFESYIIKHKIYFRIGCGFTDWRWIYHQKVS